MSLCRIPFFDPARMGRGLRVLRDPGPLMAAAPETFTEPPVYPWDGMVIPTPAQRGDSCNAEGACRELSIAILAEDPEAIPHGMYLEPWPVYVRARDLFWIGQGVEGGLYPSQAYDALEEMDCVPADTGLRMPPETWDGLCRALRIGPVSFGGLIHDGYGRFDPANGCIDHAPRPTDASAGHWMTIIGTLMQGGRRFVVIAQSWGPDMYWHGIMLMTWEEFREVRLARFLAFRLAPGISRYPGWRKLLKRLP
jgi:hypothetical protein